MQHYILPLHRWTGMTAGLVLVLMALTGAAIVFRAQLEPVLNSDLLTVAACSERASLDALTAHAQAVRPAAKLDYIRLVAGEPGAPRMPAAAVRFTDQAFVYLNPCSGAVLGQRHRYGGVLGTIEQVHRFRFMPNGSWITGSCALLFAVVLAGGGLYLWLPSARRGFRRSLGVHGAARMGGWHRRAGVLAGLIILASALTGLPQAFEWYKDAVYMLAGSSAHEARPRSAPPAGRPRLSPDELWRRAQLLVPQPQEMLMHYAAAPRAPVDLYLIGADAPHPNARTMLYFDAYDGKVLSFTPYAASSAGHKLYFWTLSLHTGQVGGLFGQLVLLAGALSVPVLAYTGTAGYLRRRRRAQLPARLRVRVASKAMEAEGICSFGLVAADGGKLPRFRAGDHIDVQLREGLVRQYSLCNDPAEAHRYLVCVRRDPESRGGSRTLHEEVEVGQVLEISAPKHRFPLDPAASHTILLAAGIGITPLLSMAEHLAGQGASFELHYCTASVARTAFLWRLRNARFAHRVSFYFSDEAPARAIDFEALLASPGSGAHVYACGPARFIEAACKTASLNGWPDSRIHKEHFAAAAISTQHDTAFELKLARSGKLLRVPPNKTALEVLRAAGIDVARSCEQGVCGSCLTRVLEGEPLHRDSYLTKEEHSANDCFTPCCSRARGDLLVVDL